MLVLAQELSHPLSLASALQAAATLSQFRREWPAFQQHTEALIRLATEQKFANWLASGKRYQGWVLITQGQIAEGITLIRQGLATKQQMRSETGDPYW